MKKDYLAPELTCENFKMDGDVTASNDIPWYIREGKQGQSFNNKECYSAVRNEYYTDGNDIIFCN